jgi:hypothetical protein
MLANSFWDHVIQISIRQMKFSEYIFPTMKIYNLFWKHLLYNIQILTFEEQFCMSNMDFYI